jgi:hypothetical protein
MFFIFTHQHQIEVIVKLISHYFKQFKDYFKLIISFMI